MPQIDLIPRVSFSALKIKKAEIAPVLKLTSQTSVQELLKEVDSAVERFRNRAENNSKSR